MTILVDSREQCKLEFNHAYITEIKVTKLDCGDYGCQFKDGHIPPFYFERKSIPDLFGTLGGGYERFKREIIRAQESKVQLFIIIEGSLFKVLEGHEHSTIEGVSIIKKLFTLWLRYGILPVFTKNREEMARYITEFYLAVGRERLNNKQK